MIRRLRPKRVVDKNHIQVQLTDNALRRLGNSEIEIQVRQRVKNFFETDEHWELADGVASTVWLCKEGQPNIRLAVEEEIDPVEGIDRLLMFNSLRGVMLTKEAAQ